MKKIFATAIAVFMMAVSPLMAQNENVVNDSENASSVDTHFTEVMTQKLSNQDDVLCKNEISVSIGSPNAVQFYGDFLGAMFGQKDIASDYVISADYSHRLNKRISVGATLNYFSATKDSGLDHNRFYSLMPHIKVDYMNNKWVTLYGKACVGVMLNDFQSTSDDKLTKETKVYCGFHISPFGIEAGPNKHFRIYTEAGFGVNGFVHAGLRYKF